jgi:hypothetical protein
MTRACRIARLVGLVASLSLNAAVVGDATSAAANLAAAPLAFSPPASIDSLTPVSFEATVHGLSCASSTLCIAVDNEGNAMTTTDPASPEPRWQRSVIDVFPLNGVSCTTVGSLLCVAIDNQGNVVSSTDPTLPVSWKVTPVDEVKGEPGALRSVSCPSSSLCVAGDTHGDVLVSTDPAQQEPTWTAGHVDGSGVITGASCVSSSASSQLCVVVDNEGNVLSSTEPTNASSWRIGHVDTQPLSSVSCAATSAALTCAAGDGGGNVLSSAEPAAGSWSITSVGTPISSVSCLPTGLCVAAGGAWVIDSAEPAKANSPWTVKRVDRSFALTGVSCATSTLCLAVNATGAVFTTSAPTQPAKTPESTWSHANLEFGKATPTAISCPEAELCVAVDNGGSVLTSKDPAKGEGTEATWKSHNADGGHAIDGVSCGSSTLCIAVDNAGNALVSTEPKAESWHYISEEPAEEQPIDKGRVLTSVACPSTELCVAVDIAGDVLTATKPTEFSGWIARAVDPHAISAVSCPTSTLCVAVDSAGGVLTSSEPANPERWSVKSAVDPHAISAVSCPTSTLCVAVDSAGDALTSTSVTLGNGASWFLMSIENRGTGFGGTAVSCPSTERCVAVGGEITSTSAAGSEGIDGSVSISTHPAGVDGHGAEWHSLMIDPAHLLRDVSCVRTEICVAVDGQEDYYVTTNPMAPSPAWKHEVAVLQHLTGVSCVATGPSTSMCAIFAESSVLISTNRGASWTTSQISGERLAGSGGSQGISCGSSKLCVAFGYGGATNSALLTTLDPTATPSSTWTAKLPDRSEPVVILGASCAATGLSNLCVVGQTGGTALISADPQAGEGREATYAHKLLSFAREPVSGVSCSSISFCIAASSKEVLISTDPADGQQSTWNPTASDTEGELTAASCAGPALCVAVDDQGHVVGSSEPLRLTSPSSGWTESNMHDGYNPITGISCVASSSLCVAVDGYGNALSTSDPAHATSWSSAGGVDGTTRVNNVSCDPSASLCVAVDSLGNVLTTTEPARPDPSWQVKQGVDGNPLANVSCPSTALCVATGGEGALTSTNPALGASATWSKPTSIDAKQSITGLSCPTSTLCIAVDAGGGVLTSTEPTSPGKWPRRAVDSHAITAVSCASTTLCVAVDNAGNVLTSTDPTEGEKAAWTLTEHVDENPASGTSSLTGISCATNTLCAAYDPYGNAVISTDPAEGEHATWTILPSVDNGNKLTALSCASLTLCVGGDAQGRVVLATPALSISIRGLGKGTVAGPGFSCTSTCTQRYLGGEAVTLTAAPAPGSIFSGWGGGSCSGTGPCEVTMNEGHGVWATFSPAPRQQIVPEEALPMAASIIPTEFAPTLRAPAVTDVTQSHSRWREGSKLAQISNKRLPIGTTFSFKLSEQASVNLAFTQAAPGRREKGKCPAQPTKNRRRSACERTVIAGALSFIAHAGTNKVHFQGRISRSKTLKPGQYALIITVSNAAGQSSAKGLTFTIMK